MSVWLAFMEKGDVKIGFGIMGGFNQIQTHAQCAADIADLDFGYGAAITEAPPVFGPDKDKSIAHTETHKNA